MSLAVAYFRIINSSSAARSRRRKVVEQSVVECDEGRGQETRRKELLYRTDPVKKWISPLSGCRTSSNLSKSKV